MYVLKILLCLEFFMLPTLSQIIIDNKCKYIKNFRKSQFRASLSNFCDLCFRFNLFYHILSFIRLAEERFREFEKNTWVNVAQNKTRPRGKSHFSYNYC